MAMKYSVRPLMAVVMIAAATLAAGLMFQSRMSLADQKPHLAGKWTFNQNQSDDTSQKVHDAEASTRTQPSGNPGGGGYPGGGYPGGGYPGGDGYPGVGGIGYPGRGGMGGMGGGRGRRGPSSQSAGQSSQDLDQLAENPKMLRIDQDDKQITVTSDSGTTLNLYPDGKKHKETDANGQKTTFRSHWDGDRLIVENKLGHSGKLTRTYELSHDGKQLYVTSELDGSGLRAPLIIRSVFDSMSAVTAK